MADAIGSSSPISAEELQYLRQLSKNPQLPETMKEKVREILKAQQGGNVEQAARLLKNMNFAPGKVAKGGEVEGAISQVLAKKDRAKPVRLDTLIDPKKLEELQKVEGKLPFHIAGALSGANEQAWALTNSQIKDKNEANINEAAKELITGGHAHFVICMDRSNLQNCEIRVSDEKGEIQKLSIPWKKFIKIWQTSEGDMQKIAEACRKTASQRK